MDARVKPAHDGVRVASHCTVMFAAFASCTATPVSLATRASKSAGVITIGSTPSFDRRSCTTALSIAPTTF